MTEAIGARTARQARFYYGWVVVAVMAAAGAASMALATLNFGLFIKPMGDELGLGRAVFGWAQTTRQVANAASSPMLGGLLDRFGSRVLLAVAAVITGTALVTLSFIHQGWQLIALFAVMGVVGLAGPGAMVTTVPVAKWFVRRRGRAMAFASLGVPVGATVFIPLTQILIDARGWRSAWVILGLTGAAVIIPLSLIFVRRAPEDLGLAPDGAPLSPGAGATRGAMPVSYGPSRHEWTRDEALRTGTFWRLTLVFSLMMLGLSSVGVHRIPHFMDRGLDPHLVSYATALDAVASGVSTFLMGMLADRAPARFLGAVGFSLIAGATLLTTVAATPAVMFLAMITFGAGIGGLVLVQNYVWADYFGRTHLGAIRGVVMPITLVFGGIGAPLAGYVRDAFGTYTGIWLAGVALFIIATAVLAFTGPPVPAADADVVAVGA
ncbi:MAG: MFS transporter [Dehalococcoidia bacterium]